MTEDIARTVQDEQRLPRDYMAQALAICDGRSNLPPTREHLLELRSQWEYAVEVARDVAWGGKR